MEKEGYDVIEEFRFNPNEMWFADICCRKKDEIILVEAEISSSIETILKNCKKCLRYKEVNKLILAIYTEKKNLLESKKVKGLIEELKNSLSRDKFNKIEIKNLMDFYL